MTTPIEGELEADAEADAAVEALRRLEITEVFHNTLAPIVELPVLHGIFSEGAAGCTAVLRDAFGLELPVTFEQAIQHPSRDALTPCAGMISVIHLVAEWGARVVIAFDRLLLFRALDAMYGGDGKSIGPAPVRALTRLELSIVERLAQAILAQFQMRLAPFVAFDCNVERIEQVFDPAIFDKDRTELVAAQLRLGEGDEWLVVAVPVRGLELARERIATPQEEAPVELDPNWSRSLEQNVGRTEVELVAVAAGPPMLLGEVARLKPGSLVEFDAELLEVVRIESDGEAIFEGQLGQTKGYLSVCIEAPLSADADEAPVEPARRRRA